MRRTATLLALLCLPALTHAQIYSPEGVNMVGQIQNPDWQNPPPQGGLIMSLDTQPGNVGTYKSGVLQAGANGFDAGSSLEWLFTSGPAEEIYRNTWKDVTVVMNVPQTYTWQGSGNNTVSPVSGRYYVVRFLDNGYANTQAVWSELTATPVTFSSVTATPSGANATITATLSAAPSSEQIYVRYSTDNNYATSTVVTASCGGTNTCTATIPASGSTSYYAFSSTSSPSANGSDAALKTINNSSSTALPVELTAFTAAADGQAAVLRWATASETNNAGFTVEQQRSNVWTALGQVAGRGTTSEQTTYQYRVADLAPGRHQFRLRQTDFDGTTSYSAVVEVTVGTEAGFAFVLRGRALHLSVREPQAVRAEAFDMLGRRVALLFDGEATGTTELALPAALPAGVYVVRVAGAHFAATRTITQR